MGFEKHTPITKFQKALIEEYYANGFDNIAAYCKVKGIPEPTDILKRQHMSQIVSKAKRANPDYIAKLESRNAKKFEKMKDKLIGQLEDVSSSYFELLQLAQQDGELSDEDNAKFKRLRSIITTKDLNKAVELIGKMSGSFDAEKVEVTNTFRVAWGEAPKLQQTTKPVIDVPYEEEDED